MPASVNTADTNSAGEPEPCISELRNCLRGAEKPERTRAKNSSIPLRGSGWVSFITSLMTVDDTLGGGLNDRGGTCATTDGTA